MRILIVDDNKIQLIALRNVLVKSGYEVVTASNGLERGRIVRGGSCQLVISDWEMPLMDGIELCRAVRSEDLAGYVYFILLTGRNLLEEKVKGLRAGADDFISKPI